jgi:hypothetical protein
MEQKYLMITRRRYTMNKKKNNNGKREREERWEGKSKNASIFLLKQKKKL